MELFKKSFLTGIVAGIFASIGGITYAWFYNTNLFDYSKLLGYSSIVAACIFICVFASIMYWAAVSILKKWGEFIFNLLFVGLTVASIGYPLTAEIKGDEFGYFVVYAIPLHYFPVLSWMVFKALVFRNK